MTIRKSKVVGYGGHIAPAVQVRQGKPGSRSSASEKISKEDERPAESTVSLFTSSSADATGYPATLSVAGDVIDLVSLLFDPDWYTKSYPDVVAAGLDPVRHFFDNGAREGRDPNSRFKTAWYLSVNADVAASKMNPFLHYLFYGAREGRKPGP